MLRRGFRRASLSTVALNLARAIKPENLGNPYGIYKMLCAVFIFSELVFRGHILLFLSRQLLIPR